MEKPYNHIATRADAYAKKFLELHNKGMEAVHKKNAANDPEPPMHPEVAKAVRSAQLMETMMKLRKARGK